MEKITSHEQLLKLEIGDKLIKMQHDIKEDAVIYTITENDENSNLICKPDNRADPEGYAFVIQPLNLGYAEIIESAVYYIDQTA